MVRYLLILLFLTSITFAQSDSLAEGNKTMKTVTKEINKVDIQFYSKLISSDKISESKGYID